MLLTHGRNHPARFAWTQVERGTGGRLFVKSAKCSYLWQWNKPHHTGPQALRMPAHSNLCKRESAEYCTCTHTHTHTQQNHEAQQFYWSLRRKRYIVQQGLINEIVGHWLHGKLTHAYTGFNSSRRTGHVWSRPHDKENASILYVSLSWQSFLEAKGHFSQFIPSIQIKKVK